MADGKLEKDIVVLKHPGMVDEETGENIKKAFKRIFADWGQDVNILFLQEGMDISIIKKDE